MNRNLIIAGSVLVVGVVIYFVWKSRKKNILTTQASAPQMGPQPGGAFAPKTLTEDDYTKLETVFKESNPFNADLAKKIEGQGIDENEPTKLDGTQKVLLTKSEFDNLVLAKIRRLIGQRAAWVQDEENRRFEEWRGAVRAGYANSLAQALAYSVRTDTAMNNYYTGSASTPKPDGSGSESGQAPVNYNGMVPESLRVLDWFPTNVSSVLTAMQKGANPQRLYFYIPKNATISQTDARSKGVTI
jgi:hypothetical protein